MPNGSFRRRGVITIALAAVIITACSSGSSTSGGSTIVAPTDATIASDATAAATTASPTSAPTTVLAPTTTVALEPLVLRSDGLGPFDFGPSTVTDVVAAITARFGPPTRNESVHYADESHFQGVNPYFESLDPREFPDFNFEYGQTVCWTGDFCAEFGGYGTDLVNLVGWRYSGPPHMLASESNLTIGAEWADFPSMIVGATCYTTGGGTHHGIKMTLAVDGGWDWLVSDGAGGYVENLPDPHATKVTSLSAGVYPFQAGDDC